MKTISRLIIGVSIIFSNNLNAQLNCEWLDYSLTDASYLTGIGVDNEGNSIAIGYFKEINIQNVILTSNPYGAFNSFVCKWDPQGNLLWLKHAGKGNQNRPESIKIDSENNIIFSGEFSYNMMVCDTTFIEDNNVGEFIMKIDKDGNCLWAKHVDFVGTFGSLPVLIDNEDNIYLLTIGHTVIDGITCDGETVITKFNKQGQILWMRSISIDIYNYSTNSAITVVLNSDKLLIGGYYKDTVSFAGNTFIPDIEMSINPYTGDTLFFSSREVLIGIMDTAGYEIAAINITSVGNHTIEAITVNNSEEIFISGKYTADTINIAGNIVTGGGSYLSKFSSYFNYVKANNIESVDICGATATNNFIYYASQNIDYMLINTYDFNCNLISMKLIGNVNLQPEYPTSLAKFPNDDILLGGHYIDELEIDSLIAAGSPYSQYKIFSCRFSDLFTGINKIVVNNNLDLYPNPTSDIFIIENKENIEINAIEILNLNGKVVKQFSSTNTQLDLSDIVSGLYFVKIKHKTGHLTKKIIIQ
jgi:hypothetical protein